MTISELSKLSKIEENTAIYVVNGCWTGYIVRDCVTDDLHLFIPIPNSKRNGIKLFYRIIFKSPTKTDHSVRKEFYDYFE